MILVRQTFQAKYGKAGEVVGHMREASSVFSQAIGHGHSWRVLTDLTGPFDTVVLEIHAESMAEWEQMRSSMFQHAAFRETIVPMMDLLESGNCQIFTIEAEG